MQDTPICADCGYELAGLKEDPPGSVRCPECSAACDLASAPRLRPWPGVLPLAKRLCGAFAVNVVAVVLMVVAMWLCGTPRSDLVRLPVAMLFIVLVCALPLTGVVHPGMAAALLVHQHVPRARKTSAFARLLGAAVGINLIVFTVGLVIAYLLDAW